MGTIEQKRLRTTGLVSLTPLMQYVFIKRCHACSK